MVSQAGRINHRPELLSAGGPGCLPENATRLQTHEFHQQAEAGSRAGRGCQQPGRGEGPTRHSPSQLLETRTAAHGMRPQPKGRSRGHWGPDQHHRQQPAGTGGAGAGETGGGGAGQAPLLGPRLSEAHLSPPHWTQLLAALHLLLLRDPEPARNSPRRLQGHSHGCGDPSPH